MRRCVIGDEISQEIQDVIALALLHRFEGIEIRSVWGKTPLDLSQRDCLRIAKQVSDAGLSLVGFASPAFKTVLPKTATERQAAKSDLECSIDRAQWLGAKFVRVFSFFRHLGTPDPALAAQTFREIVSTLVDLPVELVVETGTRTNTPTAVTMVRFIEELGDPTIGVLWDPANGVFSGLEPFPYPDGYQLIARHIRHVHVKDPIGTSHYARLGEGQVPWQRILNQLCEDRYTGFVSLETHWRKSRRLTADERDHPGGYGFSHGGCEATNDCMRALSAMLTQGGKKSNHPEVPSF